MKSILLSLFILSITTSIVKAQTVTTFINGTPDDAIAIDANGNIYCSNYTGDTVFKFTPAGEVFSFVTGLNTPNGLAFNSNEELYVCDGQGSTIYKYDLDGNELASYPVKGHPSGIIKSLDSDTMIFTNYTTDKLSTLTPDGIITEISAAAALNGPVGLAYDDDGNLFVGNFNNREIYKVLENGELDYIATVGEASSLGFIAYGQGKLWGTVLGEHKIYVINPDGVDEVSLFAGSVGGTQDGAIDQATFNQPNGILFNDTEDVLYITDFGQKNLRIISDVVLGNDTPVLDEIRLKLYPNPAKNVLHISALLKTPGSYTIRIADVLGKEVFKKTSANVFSEINDEIKVNQWKNGVYFVTITAGQHTISRKIVK